ncbi:MAG: glycoside hydrolase family 65 protein [Acidobacteria bacterium]|nr:glycoside hydrolase family 65 protein [Acidobacteriota bacterium]
MTAWSLVYEKFDPDSEGLREALCTLGNGYFATRGAAPEAEAGAVHYPGTYLAGGYNRLTTEIAGRPIENEDLVNFPNWLPLTFRIARGKWFNLLAVEILSYRQELDLKRGVLLREVRFRDKQGRQTRLTNRRLVHMGNPHLAAIETTLTAENWSGQAEFRSALDGRVVNAGVERYKNLNSKHLKPLETGAVGEDSIYLKVQTTQSEIRMAQAARTQVFQDGDPVEVERRTIRETGYIAQQFSVNLREGIELSIEKVVTVFTSRDFAVSECGLQARDTLSRAGRFPDLLESHTLSWEHLWRRFDIEVTQASGSRTEMILHLHLFHLLQIASMHTIDLDAGIPARGWHGEAYRGHVFWDELFIFPLLNLRVPEITRALLLYRYQRLDEARAGARKAGYRGAMYPWQSGSTGREETQQVHLNPRSGRWIEDNSCRQRHVNAAIVYNIWQYYQTTRNMEFMALHGAEMILEIARFWASIATYNADRDRYEILGVMGPDEYHDGYLNGESKGLNNNAYTNIMAVWVICRALETLDLLRRVRRARFRELWEKLELTQEEIDHWQQLSRKMRIVFHEDGIISQFEGYEQLEEFDWEGYKKKYGNIHRLDRILEAEGDTPNRYKASKQADVLMLFYLFSSEELAQLFEQLGYPFEYETIPKNIEYYMKRTSHGSTLSRVVHSWVLARSDRARSWQLFNEALESDIADIQNGTTAEGIHLGAMAGSVDLMQRAFTGLETRGDVLRFNPCLPEELTRLCLQIRYRRHLMEIEISHTEVKIRTVTGSPGPVKIGFRDQVCELREGETKEFPLSGAHEPNG